MKPHFSKQRRWAMTIVEVLVFVVVLAFLFIYFYLPIDRADRRHAQRLNCVSNLRLVSDAFGSWADDHNNQYPMPYSTNNTPEWPAITNMAVYFQAASNELSTPNILICPADREHIPATNWTTDFNNSHISYFINPDASEAYPQQIMSGDDNLAVNGVPVKPGLLLLPANAEISWTAERHGRVGNLSFANGSVAEESSSGFQNALALATNGTPFMTNRIVIP